MVWVDPRLLDRDWSIPNIRMRTSPAFENRFRLRDFCGSRLCIVMHSTAIKSLDASRSINKDHQLTPNVWIREAGTLPIEAPHHSISQARDEYCSILLTPTNSSLSRSTPCSTHWEPLSLYGACFRAYFSHAPHSHSKHCCRAFFKEQIGCIKQAGQIRQRVVRSDTH